MSTKHRILLDCDPGIDDAFALLCALRFTELAAITTVSGNVSIDNTTKNARFLVDLAGAEVPVHRGASGPLEVESVVADDIHGARGLGHLSTPDVAKDESTVGATDAIIDFCAAGRAIVVATGPLTNIALALEADPSLANRIERLYWMGGSTTAGNVTEHAEFNAWADPHALHRTLESGVPLTMFGLNLTHQVRMGTTEIDRLRSANTVTSNMLADFLDFYRRESAKEGLDQPMHDPCAVLGLTHPELFATNASRIVTVPDHRAERGRTQINEAVPDVHHLVATHAEAAAVIDLIIEAAANPTQAA